jgi:7,8-dihydro-6-hydroxymethylpterin-pyrophosphokinase
MGGRTLCYRRRRHARLRHSTAAGRLALPHPRLHVRLFALVPCCDLAPFKVHAGCAGTFAGLVRRLPAPPDTLRASLEPWPIVWDK